MAHISQKIVALTGASSGIGEATARQLAAAGMKIVAGARRTERLQKLVEEIRAAGGEAVGHEGWKVRTRFAPNVSYRK